MISFAEFLFEGPYTQAMLSKLQGNSIRKTPSGAKASQGKQGRQREIKLMLELVTFLIPSVLDVVINHLEIKELN